eukprot:425006-Amorphochlora_amoeboformis.AAC.1
MDKYAHIEETRLIGWKISQYTSGKGASARDSVLLRIKRELREFVVETKTSEPVEKLATEIGELHNLILYAERLAGQIYQLAKYGPMRKQP